MTTREHGGGLDAAAARWGGRRADWLDLSTGINPLAYPVGTLPPAAWTALPDRRARDRLIDAARRFWGVPDGVAIVPAPGLSSIIVRLPAIAPAGPVHIAGPTYNEYAAAWRLAGRRCDGGPDAAVRVFVHPNNPDGHLWDRTTVLGGHRALTIVDESFCDTCPHDSHVAATTEPGVIVLKSFGKFWGLAGLRLGFAIGTAETLARPGRGTTETAALAELLGPWPVSGPALEIGARALADGDWAAATRRRLAGDARRLDAAMAGRGRLVGGTTLFRLYEVDDAEALQARLAARHVWTRRFSYNRRWLRLGLPHPDRWDQLDAALAAADA